MQVKTNPQNVKEAHEALFYASMNLPAAAAHCGMTVKQLKLTFWEYLKYHEPNYMKQEIQSMNFISFLEKKNLMLSL